MPAPLRFGGLRVLSLFFEGVHVIGCLTVDVYFRLNEFFYCSELLDFL